MRGVWNSSSAVAGLPFGSANRRICGFAFGCAQIPTAVGTSHIPRTLDDIAKWMCKNKNI